MITQEDRPQGRGHRVLPPPVKVLALQRGIPVHQPVKVRSAENKPLFESPVPDLIVVVSYGQILPAWLLELPRFGAINVHASLLPKYRGAAPIQWALLNGEDVTGVTTMQMETGLDSGPILLQEKTPISPDETSGELHDRLAVLGAQLLTRTLGRLSVGALEPQIQDSLQVTLAPKITKEMGVLEWQHPALQIHNQIRGLNPWPGCQALFRDAEVKIWRSRMPSAQEASFSSADQPGRLHVSHSGQLFAECGDGRFLELTELSLPGRKKVSGRDFVHGIRIQPGEKMVSGTLRLSGS